MNIILKRILCFLLLVIISHFPQIPMSIALCMAGDFPSNKWDNIINGVTIKKFSFNGVAGNKINLIALRVDPSKYSAKVIDTVAVIGKQNRTAIYSLKESAKATRPVVIINGGFSASYSFPIPAGLLVINGKEIKKMNTDSSVQSGVFMASDKGWSIIHRSKYKSGKYTNALQSGPLIIEPSGVVGIKEIDVQKHKAYRRSVLGIDKLGRLILIVTEEVNLYDLAQFLVQSDEIGGLGCTVALNLSGDVESSLIILDSKYYSEFGNTDVPIASAIAIFPK
jgi:uncharacterized protein YigE (DUF2233 family)